MTRPVSPAPSLPRGLRLAAIVSLLFSAPTGFLALSESLGLGQLAEHREAMSSSPFSIVGDPSIDARITQAQYNALEPQRESRALVLGALSVACAFVFVSAGRILRPDGLPLERMRRMLSGSALVVAVLRTVDGAQWAVVAKRMAPVIVDAMKTLPSFQGVASEELQVMIWLMPAISMAFTAFVAGTFVVLGQYFQSDSVRHAIHAQDGALAEEEE
ncbi:hypothetical protein [Melittangium boletus]|uniref:Uncharacterized protein n=1 Tax=Melittangium boletus DSM 14713 TaxID=1294270 RepID=A0A250ILU8_9BACT|nr:hypothetical protein [Melittangium boletus]ATB32200.1 hypothetical protein MEBOL_005676 [Melittangium boletus DSM 14713]